MTMPDATLAALSRAARHPGKMMVCTPNDEVVVVVGNAGLRVVLDELRRQVDQLIRVCGAAGPKNAADGGICRVLTGEAEEVWQRSAAAWAARREFLFDDETRPYVVAAMIEPLADELCRAWPVPRMDDFRAYLGYWVELWRGGETSAAYAEMRAAITGLEIVTRVQLVDDVWVERALDSGPQTAGIVCAVDMPTAVANINHLPEETIQRIADPGSETRWLGRYSDDDLFMMVRDEPLRSTMETFVRANSKSGMLATRDPKPLENLTKNNIYVITPAALDALAHVLANHEADTRREFVDISLTTIARILMRAEVDVEPVRKSRRQNNWGYDSSSSSDERPESVSGLEAARRHMHAWLNLLPRQWDLARTGLDDQLNSMTRRCDLQVLREIQSLRDEFRSSQERLMASQQETQASQKETQASQQETHCLQQEMQALLTQLAERVDDNTHAGHDRDGTVMRMLREQQETLSTQQDKLNQLLERQNHGRAVPVEG